MPPSRFLAHDRTRILRYPSIEAEILTNTYYFLTHTQIYMKRNTAVFIILLLPKTHTRFKRICGFS